MKILIRVSAGKFKHTYCQVLTTDITVLHEPTDFSTLTNEFVHFLLRAKECIFFVFEIEHTIYRFGQNSLLQLDAAKSPENCRMNGP
jgi:hypothetical protein